MLLLYYIIALCEGSNFLYVYVDFKYNEGKNEPYRMYILFLYGGGYYLNRIISYNY